MTNNVYTEGLSHGLYIRAYSNGWSDDEEQLLFTEAENCRKQGGALRAVFESVARRTGRKPNSVRNHYYLRIKQEDMQGSEMQPTAFVPFTQQEVEALLEDVLTGRANGESVRACTIRLAGGDDKLMLRYQNKYRAVIKKEPELVAKITERLAQRGINVPAICSRNGYDYNRITNDSVNSDSIDRKSVASAISGMDEFWAKNARHGSDTAEIARHMNELVSLLAKRAEAADSLRQRLEIQYRDMEAQRERFMLLHSMFQRLISVSRELVEAVRGNHANGRNCAELLCGIEDCERIAGLIV